MSRWWTTNDDWDQDKASDGYSRFGAYLTAKLHRLEPGHRLGPGEVDVEWVTWCWETATEPIMSPGYVSWSGPIASTQLFRDDWDGQLAATVTVLTKVHIGARWRTWEAAGIGSQRWVEPERPPMALGEVQLTAPLQLLSLVRPESPADVALVPEAKTVLRKVIAALDDQFASAIDQLTETVVTGP